jgi:hypothetical protein
MPTSPLSELLNCPLTRVRDSPWRFGAPKQIAEAEKLVKEHLNEIRSAWAKHFPG